MTLTDAQKKQLIGIGIGVLLLLAVQVAAVFGIDVVVPRIAPRSGGAAASGVDALAAGSLNGYVCNAGTGDCLRSLYGRDIEVYSDGGSTSRFSVDGSTGSVTLAGAFAPVAASTTVTNSQTITPSASMNFITASVASTITLGTPAVNGLYALENTSTYTVTIVDSGTTVMSAAWSAGQYDTLWLWYDGSRWVELSRSDN